MKILHVVEPLATGINTFILQLTDNITEADHVILHGIRKNSQSFDTIKEDYRPEVKFIHWKSAQREIRPFRDFDAFHELKRTIEEEKPDVVHLHSSKAGILGRIVAKRIGYKNIVYTPNAVSFLRKDVGRMKLLMYKSIEKLSSFLPGKVIASSDCELQAYKEIKVDAKLIYNGAKILDANAQNDPEKLKIVNCGVISTQKNPTLFNQIAKAFEDDQELSFTWIGDGVDREELDSKNIEILGWKSKKDVFKVLGSSDIYLSTSLWEGLPLAGIEAMGSGLAMLMHSCPGNDNLIFDNKNGSLFESADEAVENISKWKENKALIDNYSEKSKEFYNQNFTDKICSSNYQNLYQSMINGDH